MQRPMVYFSKPNRIIDVSQTNNTETEEYSGGGERGGNKTEENQGLQGSAGGIVLREANKPPAQSRRQNKGASAYSYGAVQWSDLPNTPSFFK